MGGRGRRARNKRREGTVLTSKEGKILYWDGHKAITKGDR